jgi:hypothetical protein
MCEQDLPTGIRGLLNAARRARPDSDVLCMSFRIVENNREVALMEVAPEIISRWSAGPIDARPRPKDLLVLSMTVTETTFENVRTISHVLVAWARPRRRPPTSASSS